MDENLAIRGVELFCRSAIYISKVEWDTFAVEKVHSVFIEWMSRRACLKPTGTLLVCGFSEILADVKHPASRFSNHAVGLSGTTGTGQPRAGRGAATKVFYFQEEQTVTLN